MELTQENGAQGVWLIGNLLWSKFSMGTVAQNDKFTNFGVAQAGKQWTIERQS